jgi:acyl-coenzyme A synthetase/AMP-(fatty) acid ligase
MVQAIIDDKVTASAMPARVKAIMVRFLAALPKTGSGKIQKRVLREQAAG